MGRGMRKEVPAKVTHRIVLPQVSSVFYPLGLFSPFTVSEDEIVAQMILEKTWAILGRTNIFRRDSFQRLGIGVELHE